MHCHSRTQGPASGSDLHLQLNCTTCRQKSDIWQWEKCILLKLYSPCWHLEGSRMGEMCKSPWWNCKLNSSGKIMGTPCVESGCTIPSTAVWPGTHIPACGESHTEMVVEHTQWETQDCLSRFSHWRDVGYVLTDCGSGDVVPKTHRANLSLSNGTFSQSWGLFTVHSAAAYSS